MHKILEKHKTFWPQRRFWAQTLLGLCFLVVSMFVNYYATSYTNTRVSDSVSDILLDNLPVVDVHLIFSEGAILFFIILIGIVLYEPKYIPFVLKSIALFILTRSFFLILTHYGPPANEIYINPTDYIMRINSSLGNDLFFSGHTGMPFLLAHIFWRDKYLRYFFFASTFIGGASVILGHLHYSIDVFSALFISFGVFYIAKKLFFKDYQLIINELSG